MLLKSKDIETSQSNNCNTFKVGGLLFDSEEDYLIFKNIDKNIYQTVKSVENGSIDINEVFNNVKTIKVKEIYFHAIEDMEDLFRNSFTLLDYKDTRFETDYKVGRCFFDKIQIIKYSESDE